MRAPADDETRTAARRAFGRFGRPGGAAKAIILPPVPVSKPRRPAPAAVASAVAAHAAANNSVRIKGGQWRSRVLKFPPIDGLRPTPDRVRETLFNWLGQDLTGLAVLDLFAGSGALAFEALSRGARLAVAVEMHPEAIRALQANAATLGAVRASLDTPKAGAAVVGVEAPPGPRLGAAVASVDAPHIDIVRRDAVRFLEVDPRRFDVIFIDPPFSEPWWPLLSPLLDARAAAGGWIYVEQGQPIEPPAGWEVHRQRQAGQVHYHLLRRRDD